MSEPAPLDVFVQSLKKVPDPRSKKGVSHPFRTVLGVALLGLLANVSTPTGIARWTKMHLTQLKKFFRFRNTGAPSRVTFSRVFQRLSLDDLQSAFAEFLNGILDEAPLAAAVDGKVAKQMKDENGDAMYAQRPLLEAIQEYHRDYLVQIKDNQEKTHQQMKLVFEDAPNEPPSDRKLAKKRGPLRFAACG